MSLQDELRAQKLAFAEDTEMVAKIAAQDLSGVTSDAGCNMLFVYLLNRWGARYEPGVLSKLAEGHEIHEAIIGAYLAAGCRADEEVAAKKLGKHLSASFGYQVTLKGKLSALAFARRMLEEIPEEASPEAHRQLRHVIGQLAGETAPSPEAPTGSGLEEAWAYLVRGREMRSDVSELADLREGLVGSGMQVFVAGDEGEARGEVDVVIGVEVAAVGAAAGVPFAVTHLGEPADGELWLIASGPLASALLIRGTLGGVEHEAGSVFHRGAGMDQVPHAVGVWGEKLFEVTASARAVAPGEAEAVYLIARYD